jgi:hypothetical protein
MLPQAYAWMVNFWLLYFFYAHIMRCYMLVTL